MVSARRIAGHWLLVIAAGLAFSVSAYAQENRHQPKAEPQKTAQANAVAKAAPAAPVQPATQPRSSEKASEPNGGDYGPASPVWTNWIQAISAALVMLMTFFLWRLSVRQTDILEANAKDTASSVAIAKQSADAATALASTAADTSRRQLRAYLRVDIGEMTNLMTSNSPEVSIRITNAGSTPAFRLLTSAQLSAEYRDEEGKRHHILSVSTESPPETDKALGPGGKSAFTFKPPSILKGAPIEAIREGRGTFTISGAVQYLDIYGGNRWTKFSHQYGGPGTPYAKGHYCDHGNSCDVDGEVDEFLVPLAT